MEVNLATPVLYTLSGIFGLLAIATFTVLGLAFTNRQTDYSELKDGVAHVHNDNVENDIG